MCTNSSHRRRDSLEEINATCIPFSYAIALQSPRQCRKTVRSQKRDVTTTTSTYDANITSESEFVRCGGNASASDGSH